MISGIVDYRISMIVDDQTALLVKRRVAHMVLGASGRRASKLVRPPRAGGCQTSRAIAHIRIVVAPLGWMIAEVGGQLARDSVELRLEAAVEHVADHRHAGRPLRHASEVDMAELG